MNIVEVNGYKINLDVLVGVPFHTERITDQDGNEKDILVFSMVEPLPEGYQDSDVGKAKVNAVIDVYKILKMVFVEESKNEIKL